MLSKAIVREITKISHNSYYLELEEKRLARQSLPGQFLHIRVSNTQTPLLRRPFSVAGVNLNKGTVQIIFAQVGEGTRTLSQLTPGDFLDCLGPLGSSFKHYPADKSPFVLVAGGMGVAPLLFLANNLLLKKHEVLFFYGAASLLETISIQTFFPEALKVILATEDGSSGYHGLVTEAFRDSIEGGLKPAQVFACGPRAMLKTLAVESRKKNLHLQVSLEERMACGIGACRGCAVMVKGGNDLVTYARVCKEGPVFNYQEVDW